MVIKKWKKITRIEVLYIGSSFLNLDLKYLSFKFTISNSYIIYKNSKQKRKKKNINFHLIEYNIKQFSQRQYVTTNKIHTFVTSFNEHKRVTGHELIKMYVQPPKFANKNHHLHKGYKLFMSCVLSVLHRY